MADDLTEAEKVKEKRAKSVANRVNVVIMALALASVSVVWWLNRTRGALPEDWLSYLAMFCAVATVPQCFIEILARLAEMVAPEIPDRTITRGFRNLGAWVGVLERPLLLGALLAGIPEFIGGWYVLKGIAGYSLGLRKKDVAERRSFQLFLINNASSLFGVALGWLVWRFLGFPSA